MKTNLAIGVCAAAALLAGGCDDTTPPPPPAQGQGLGGLSESPTSLPGRSAAAGREAGRLMTQGQEAAAGMAGEITGETQAVSLSGLIWNPPSGWEKAAPANAMQKAALRVAPDEGEGEAMVVFFSGIGGDSASNIERWRGQVTSDSGGPADADVQKRTVAGIKVMLVSMEGTYSGMASGSTQAFPGFAFRGAIVESPGGPVHIRFTGPKAVVEQNHAAWEAMVLGMRKQ